ncbi:hypothetical protein [Bacillus inaquosorum]|uniref:hypothetical protein n=1 Tax=Bacillus inaquosorum TaxID=483913 RepID=UPI00227DF4E9|nr:hypothetical protein [Bacillus inaquosorum]MCY7907949.1 hypothetical protein [Bacillus inaquosorum]MCY8860697.1 hypothetical protein [Bacillus inaquosorum]MCY8875500.1 hypothetical protein [Bacillus inaquosorum]
MRISEIFNLEKDQSQLDFVDIDIEEDLPLFLDPYFLSLRSDSWSVDAHRTIQSFFHYVLDLYRAGRKQEAKALFVNLSEPNETCLGVSTSNPRGRGVGTDEAAEIFNNLASSEVIEQGLLSHLEDMIIFIENVGKDKISDLTTNVIRKHLIEYTQSQCKLHGIELTKSVPTGFFWDASLRKWDNIYSEMLIIEGRKILLVPKSIVTFSYKYTHERYCQHFVLNFLQHEHLRINSSLVKRKTLKDGTEKVWVSKKDIAEKEGTFRKEYLRDFTKQHPQIFKEFRESTRREIESLRHEELEQETFDIESIVDLLIEKLRKIPKGTKYAGDYHRHILGIMEFIFYPDLTRPVIEQEIHDGRKRIDISFDNSASKGFFHQLHSSKGISSQFIFVECKNYTSDVANPELDQLSGRFSPNRGKFGLLVCREIDDMERFLARCADTYHDYRGMIIPIVDNDFIIMLNQIKNKKANPQEDLLSERMRKIILR